MIPLCATVFYACGNANERICDDKRGDEASDEGRNVINLWCKEDIKKIILRWGFGALISATIPKSFKDLEIGKILLRKCDSVQYT